MTAVAIVAFLADRLRDHLFFFSYNVQQLVEQTTACALGK
jgi:hypothetical protein